MAPADGREASAPGSPEGEATAVRRRMTAGAWPEGEATAGDVPREDPEVARARALALLEANHQFPCAYELTVIAFNRAHTTAAVRGAVVQDGEPASHQIIESGAGKYVSHRFSVQVAAAVEVLSIYARVREVEGGVTVL